MKLIAIKKGGKYYCRSNEKYPADIPDEDRLRFDIAKLESFNPKWIVFGALPTTAEICKPSKSYVVEYRLKEGYEVTDKIPAILPPESFDCIEYDNECECRTYDNEDIKGLYEQIRKDQPNIWEPTELEIDLIDEDCEPLINPKYNFKTEFPYYIENHVVVRHKYPCYIKGTSVFQLIRDACKKSTPDHCRITSDYNFHFSVEVKVVVLHDEIHKVDVSSFNSRKPKWVNQPLRHIEMKVIDIQTERKYSGKVIQDVKADNYEELEKKMDALILEYINMMDWKPTVCPNCKGHGWVE